MIARDQVREKVSALTYMPGLGRFRRAEDEIHVKIAYLDRWSSQDPTVTASGASDRFSPSKSAAVLTLAAKEHADP